MIVGTSVLIGNCQGQGPVSPESTLLLSTPLEGDLQRFREKFGKRVEEMSA